LAGTNTLAFLALLSATKKKFYNLTPDEGDVETDGQGIIFKTNGQFQMSDTKRHKFKWRDSEMFQCKSKFQKWLDSNGISKNV
jgi:hypothetical protein